MTFDAIRPTQKPMHHHPIGFLDLPGEIRNQIYSLAYGLNDREECQGYKLETWRKSLNLTPDPVQISLYMFSVFPDIKDWLSHDICRLAAAHAQIAREMFSWVEPRDSPILISIKVTTEWFKRKLKFFECDPKDIISLHAVRRSLQLVRYGQKRRFLNGDLKIFLMGLNLYTGEEADQAIKHYIYCILKLIPELQSFELHVPELSYGWLASSCFKSSVDKGITDGKTYRAWFGGTSYPRGARFTVKACNRQIGQRDWIGVARVFYPCSLE